jgi:lambda family phage tail tape measure protein
MADLSYTVGVNTSAANAALTSLQGKVAGLTASFGKLQGALSGLAIGAAVASAVRYADAIVDLKNATGIATATIAGFSLAVQQNGGEAEKAREAILKLSQNIGDAAAGSQKAQDAFKLVGVSMSDLRNLSEEELLRKTIDGLAQISDASKRAAAQADVFGKALKGVDTPGVAAGLNAAISSQNAYAGSAETAAATMDKFERSMTTFRNSILRAIEPLADFVNKLDQKKVDEFIDAVVKIGAAATGLLALGKALQWVGSIVAVVGSAFALFKTGLFTLSAGFATFITGLKHMGDTFKIAFSVLTKQAIPAWLASGTLKQLFAEISLTLATLGKRFGFLIAGSAAAGSGFALMGVGLAKMIPFIGWLITGITALDWIIKKAFDFSPIDWFTNKVSNAYDAFKRFIGLKAGMPEPPASDPGLKSPTAEGVMKHQVGNAGKTPPRTKRVVEISEEAKAFAAAIAKQRREMQGMTDEFVNQNAEIINNINLENMLIGKSKDYADVSRAQEDLIGRTTAKIKELSDAKANLTDKEKAAGLGAEYDAQIAKVKELAAAEQERIKRVIENQNRLQSIEQLRLYGIQREIDLQNQIISVQDEIAKSTMTTIEKKYYDIEAAAKASARAAIQAEEARVGRKLTADEVKAYYDAAIKGAEDLKAIVDLEYQNSRDFSTGWAQAFNEYAENATNAAQRARDIFNQATQGMEDMIVNFAKTGKFEWKSFVNDMLVTLLRSQLQQTISNLFGGIKMGGKSGGLLGGKIIPGFLASGGPASSNRSYIVGERGPELFTPASNGTVTPNSALGGQNVTYNISAVDARSFQALIAQDPSFIHAVAMAGSRDTARR